MSQRWSWLAAMSLAIVAGLELPSAFAQQRVTKEDAVAVVDGVVKQVFRSSRQNRSDLLVQVDVQRSEARRRVRNSPPIPAPGDVVYVHVPAGSDSAPTEDSTIRAYLTPREQGGWEGVAGGWFEQAGGRPAAPADPFPGAGGAADRMASSSLGMTTEVLRVKDKIALRVTSVERGGPAQKAGIEVGDVLVGVNKAAFSSGDQLETMARRGEPLPVVVVDVNSGKTAEVEIKPMPRMGGEVARPTEPQIGDAPPGTAPRSLGISAEPVQVGQRTALKISRVEPGSPAQKAGIEVGDVLVAANGVPITGPEQLAVALRKSGPNLTLTVRDVRSGRDTPVQVALGGTKPTGQLPGELESPLPAGRGGDLGLVTELSFYDVEAAVKITEVSPGSAGERAGLRPGMIIISANGKPVLHPNELADAARKSDGAMKLVVVDPNTNRKGMVEVNLR